MPHKIIIIDPPGGGNLVADDSPSVRVEYQPSHTLNESQQERQYSRIVKLVHKIITIAAATGNLPDE